MKRMTVLFLAAIMCLTLAACRKAPEPEQSPQEPTGVTTDAEGSGEKQQSMELIGPWHLDSEKNDLAAFADLFPGYGEWGASMEIRSNGQMSWYIGADGWHGTYTVSDGMLHAQLTSDLEQSTQTWDFRITAEHETAMLEMDYQDMTIYWAYGDREDVPAMGVPTMVYVDRQGTDEIYSSLSITRSETGYVVEMGIYRLATFSGTAVEEDGLLVYTDDMLELKGVIRYDDDQAVFEVTASTWDLAEAGTTWVFPERLEGD